MALNAHAPNYNNNRTYSVYALILAVHIHVCIPLSYFSNFITWEFAKNRILSAQCLITKITNMWKIKKSRLKFSPTFKKKTLSVKNFTGPTSIFYEQSLTLFTLFAVIQRKNLGFYFLPFPAISIQRSAMELRSI